MSPLFISVFVLSGYSRYVLNSDYSLGEPAFEIMSWKHEQISHLIDEYAKHSCLYVVKHKDYHNKNIRSLALQAVCKGLANLKPAVTESEVHKKFQGLRTTYANERKKVMCSIRSGMGEEEMYKPTLWYFNKMGFLNDHLNIRPSVSSFNLPVSEESRQSTQFEELETGDVAMNDFPDADVIFSPTATDESSEVRTVMSPITEDSRAMQTPVSSRGRKRPAKPDQNEEFYAIVSKSIDQMTQSIQLTAPPQQEDKTEEDIFDALVAKQLKRIKNVNLRTQTQLDIHFTLTKALLKDNE